MVPPSVLRLATEEFQHISTHIDDPVDILSLSSACVATADALRSSWVWKEHLNVREIDTTSLHLPTGKPSITSRPAHWKGLARLACSLFIVRSPLAGTSLAIQDTQMARSLALKNALGPSYLRKLDSVTAMTDSRYCLLCGDTTLLRLLAATNERPGALVSQWVSTMARLLYHEMTTHGSVSSVSLRSIQEQMNRFGAPETAFYETRPLDKLKPTSIMYGTIITMHILHAINASSSYTPNCIAPLRRIPAARSGRIYNPFLSLDWNEGRPLHFVGYYTYYVRQPVGHVPSLPDPPTSLFLRRDLVTGRMSGEGIDGVGEFSIDGEVLNNGMISFTKSYQQWSWNWQGVVLPWGIAGVWGRSKTWRGMFFIWLEEAASSANG
ncbi:hypothetical protein FRB95_010752 [Tulasnella sp. JGI-2019a]|nr:hypothetical protein FRB95_010752 [Tulasnella sp. JGI-2019a]